MKHFSAIFFHPNISKYIYKLLIHFFPFSSCSLSDLPFPWSPSIHRAKELTNSTNLISSDNKMYVNISLSYKYLFPLTCHLKKYYSKKEKKSPNIYQYNFVHFLCILDYMYSCENQWCYYMSRCNDINGYWLHIHRYLKYSRKYNA